MHPTIDEQLLGVLRLLKTIDGIDHVPDEAREVLANVRRLISHAQRANVAAQAFYDADNQTLTDLLAQLGPESNRAASMVSAREPAQRNTDLRAVLSDTIQNLPCTAAGDRQRGEIGRYLLRRVEQDPI